MTCFWCNKDTADSRDHVFSRLFGGTLEADLWVPACPTCRALISPAEDEVAHRSHLSLHRYAMGISPRHPERETSGLIEARISLVKDPETRRYSVFSLRLDSPPRTLPALEVDFHNNELYFHGSDQADAVALVQTVCAFLPARPSAAPGEVVGELTVRRLDEYRPDLIGDVDFNPRIYLSPREQLEICARTPEEAIRMMHVVANLAALPEFQSHKPSAWRRWQIPAGHSHQVAFAYNHLALARVVLKMVASLVGAGRRMAGLPQWYDVELHDLVRGLRPPDADSVRHVGRAKLSRQDEELKLIVVADLRDGFSGGIALYGDCYVVQVPSVRVPDDSKRTFGAILKVNDPKYQTWMDSMTCDQILGAMDMTDGR